MGTTSSTGRRNHQNPPPSSHRLVPPTPYFYHSEQSPPPPPPAPPNYVFAAAGTNPTNQYSPAPPPPVHSNYYYPGWYTTAINNYSLDSFMGRPNYFGNHQGNGWGPIRMLPSVVGSTQQPPPQQYVAHQTAKKVKNNVNVRKETIKVEIDENNPDHYLVSFVFDALFDGSITIYYFAKEEANCLFTPVFPEAHVPVKVPFQKGLGQKFQQPSGTGIDLGFFELEDLARTSPEEDVYPLVISAEVCSTSSLADDDSSSDTRSDGSPHFQITQAVLEKRNMESFQVKVMRQVLWIDGVCYELRDLYGIGSSASEGFNDEDLGKECVICMTEPKDTAVLPCRHMCMCSECAKELRLQSNKCPICRQPIEELIVIKLNNANHDPREWCIAKIKE
ncbi:hypothetical protein Dimus_029098 [Dionaea muscipula]